MSEYAIDPALQAGNHKLLAGYKATHFQWQVTDGVATITLNRAERKNPLTFDSYAELRDRARVLLGAGQPVLVDATFLQRAHRGEFIALARELGVPCRILLFDAPEAVLRERVRRRAAAGGDPSEATEAVLTRQLAEREPLSAAEAALAWPVDTRAAVDWAQLPPAWR